MHKPWKTRTAAVAPAARDCHRHACAQGRRARSRTGGPGPAGDGRPPLQWHRLSLPQATSSCPRCTPAPSLRSGPPGKGREAARLPRRVLAPGDHHGAPGRGPGGRPGGGVRRARARVAWRLAGREVTSRAVATLTRLQKPAQRRARRCGCGVSLSSCAPRAPRSATPPPRARPPSRPSVVPAVGARTRASRTTQGWRGRSRRRPVGPGRWGPAVRAAGPSARWAGRPTRPRHAADDETSHPQPHSAEGSWHPLSWTAA